MQHASRCTSNARQPSYHWSATNRPHFPHQPATFAMLCIIRGPVAPRPLIGMHQCCPILHYYPRPRYANKWFSQSSQLLARRKHYTPEQVAAFINHYAALGLNENATDKDIRKAYRSLSLRFHPDMMRNVDSKEYLNHPDRPEFVKASPPSWMISPAEGIVNLTIN